MHGDGGLPLRNLEIKVRTGDLDSKRRLALALGASDEGTSHDIDTYFHAAHGRLKLRQRSIEPGGILIAYQRPDQHGSRYSAYQLVSITDGDGLRSMLNQALGTLTIVTKRRQLLLYGATRIHLDDVEGLGSYIELETVMHGQSEADARAEHDLVIQALRLHEDEVIPVSYSDLILISRDTTADSAHS